MGGIFSTAPRLLARGGPSPWKVTLQGAIDRVSVIRLYQRIYGAIAVEVLSGGVELLRKRVGAVDVKLAGNSRAAAFRLPAAQAEGIVPFCDDG